MNDELEIAAEDGPAPDRRPSSTADRLRQTDMAAFFGPGGPVARRMPDYEERPSQVQMAEAVKRALLQGRHALIEAPTGTGKSIAYLVPAILTGKTVVVATANKSLQNQLFTQDLPFLRQVLGQAIDAVLVKGRSNYVCTYKWEREAGEQERFALVDREAEEVTFLRRWLRETDTGDVDDLPFVLNSDLRPRIVSFPDDCLQHACPHYDDNCWVNAMRDRAAAAQVLVTNHHLLLNALELGRAGERILPPAAIYIIDEAHGLESTATAVFETSLTDYTVELVLSRSMLREQVDEDELDELRFANTLAFQEVANLSRESSFRLQGDLEAMKKLGHQMEKFGQKLTTLNPYGAADDARPQDDRAEERRAYELTIEAVNSAAAKLLTIASSRRDEELVRYGVRVNDRRHISLELHAAPINPAALLTEMLFHPEPAEGGSEEETAPAERVVICTSATLATAGSFDHFKARCGLLETGEERILPPVFDYPRQALLYQPPLPPYDYRNADAYYDAVAAEIERLLEVSRGRALCLFTNWSGLQQVGSRLTSGSGATIWPVRLQGDAPRNTLLDWFRATPHSVLLATRSFWEGIDIPGDDLSLVVLDKMPFPTPSDPLHSARMANLEEAGHSSFGSYMLPLMTLALKQGFGRLIRRRSDRGVVAILDERLSSKGYGRQARHDLPAARFSREFKDVHRFFQSALSSEAEFALNVWAWREREGGPLRWRWQLLRLQDGRADDATGAAAAAVDPAEAEVTAALAAFEDLHRRIARAGRSPDQYSVELRCSPAAADRLQTGKSGAAVVWKHLQIVALGA